MSLTLILALCLTLPPAGQVVAEFEPSAGFSGHWGIDLAAEVGSEFPAPIGGVVTFAGRVAGMKSVTILSDHGIRVSMSYLSSIDVAPGDRLATGEVVGRSGLAHGEAALHLSVRVGAEYTDPMDFLCRQGTIRLLPDR